MKKIDSINAVSQIMSIELEKHFAKLLDCNDKDHDLLYMVATLLNLRFKMILEAEQIAHAKKECLKLLCNGEYEGHLHFTGTELKSSYLMMGVTSGHSDGHVTLV